MTESTSAVAGVGGLGLRAKVVRRVEDYGKYAENKLGATVPLRQPERGRFSFKESSEKVSLSPFTVLIYFGRMFSFVWCPFFFVLIFCYAGPTLTRG